MVKTKSNYMRGFIPFAVAACVLSLCGGFTASLPATVSTQWNMAQAVTYISLAYSVGAAALAPIMGKLGDALGRRKMILIAMAVYTLGQVLIAVCPSGSLAWMLISRFIAGAGAAGMAPVIVAYIMTKFPPEKVGQGFSIYMFLSCLMTVFGPTLGGIVIARAGWRIVMVICVALCLLSLAIVFFLVEKEEKSRKKVSETLAQFDYLGAVFVLIFFASFMCLFTFGQNNGWISPMTLTTAVIAVVSLLLLFFIERGKKTPILSGAFMARRQFVIPVLVLFLTQGLMQSCMTNIITFCIYTTGNQLLSSIATSVMYIGMAIGTIVIGPMSDKKEPRMVAAISLLFVIAGSGLQLLITVSSGLPIMCAALFLIGLGLGGNCTTFLKVALSGCAPELANSGSGTYNVFRDMSSPFGVAVFVPMFLGGIDVVTLQDPNAAAGALSTALHGCESALHTTALVQMAFVIIGFFVCFAIPKVHSTESIPEPAE